MGKYFDKFQSLIVALPYKINQTSIGKRLGRKFIITSDPEYISELYKNKTHTRSSVSRRIVEHSGAYKSQVSQDPIEAQFKGDQLKKVLNPDTYEKVFQTTWQHLDSRYQLLCTGNKEDLYRQTKQAVEIGFLEHVLGIEINDRVLDIVSKTGHHTPDENFEKLFLLNVFKLPYFIKDLFSPLLKKRNRHFHNLANAIYELKLEKPGSHLENLKNLEQQGRLTRLEVLGEIRSMFINSSTFATSLIWAIYMLSNVPEDYRKTVLEMENGPRFVFMEAIRMFPPFPMISYEPKTASKCPFHFGPKEITIVSVLQTHRSPHNWDYPDNFWPERHAKGLSYAKKGSFIPFGGGDRKCPGVALSMYVVPKLIEKIFSKYKFTETTYPVIKKRLEEPQVEITLDNNRFMAHVSIK